MPKKFDKGRLEAELKRYLQTVGPSTAGEVSGRLGISQPVFSRLAAGIGPDLLVVGKARSTRYALRREINGVGFSAPIYEILENGESIHFATLHGIWPKGFYLEAKGKNAGGDFFGDLPYFLEDLRPSGFLGRLIPRRHPELHVPDDIRLWSADHCLQYLVRFGANSIGDFVIGDSAFKLHLASLKNPPDMAGGDERASVYGKMADDVLLFGPVGSSAAGEQPKFLATRGPEGAPVIIKFSPQVKDEISERVADLLVCEHIAHGVLERHGFASAKSALLTGGGRTFLEMERFDRVGLKGRRGLVSLGALALQFAGTFGSWSEMSEELARRKIIDENILKTIREVELFGRLIANTDMHMANLSFFAMGTRILGLAPAYDILPMMYAPQHAQLVDRTFEPPPPMPADSPFYLRALSAARDFWREVQLSGQISAGFKSIARSNAEKIG